MAAPPQVDAVVESTEGDSPCQKRPRTDTGPQRTEGHVEVIKSKDMVERDTALLDSFICGFQRTTTLFFGRIVSNPADLPQFQDWLGYNMTYNKVPSGNGNALHLHNSVEIFVAMDGPFEIGYGTKGEHSAILQPMDFVACPAGVYHYYKNVDGSQDAQILTILPGRPSVTWAPEVVEQAREKGALCDGRGVLKLQGRNLKGSMSMDAPKIDEKVFRQGDISPFVMKHADKNALYLSSKEGWIQLGWKDLDAGESVEVNGEKLAGPVMQVHAEDPHDILVIVLRGSVDVVGPSLAESLGQFDMFKLPKKPWASVFKASTVVTLLVVRSNLPHNFDFFFSPDAGISTPMGHLPSSLLQ